MSVAGLAGGVTRYRDAAAQKRLRLPAQHIEGDLIGGRGGNLGAGGKEIRMGRFDEGGVLTQHARRPQRTRDVVPQGLEVGSKAAVEKQRRVKEGHGARA